MEYVKMESMIMVLIGKVSHVMIVSQNRMIRSSLTMQVYR